MARPLAYTEFEIGVQCCAIVHIFDNCKNRPCNHASCAPSHVVVETSEPKSDTKMSNELFICTYIKLIQSLQRMLISNANSTGITWNIHFKQTSKLMISLIFSYKHVFHCKIYIWKVRTFLTVELQCLFLHLNGIAYRTCLLFAFFSALFSIIFVSLNCVLWFPRMLFASGRCSNMRALIKTNNKSRTFQLKAFEYELVLRATIYRIHN